MEKRDTLGGWIGGPFSHGLPWRDRHVLSTIRRGPWACKVGLALPWLYGLHISSQCNVCHSVGIVPSLIPVVRDVLVAMAPTADANVFLVEWMPSCDACYRLIVLSCFGLDLSAEDATAGNPVACTDVSGMVLALRPSKTLETRFPLG